MGDLIPDLQVNAFFMKVNDNNNGDNFAPGTSDKNYFLPFFK